MFNHITSWMDEERFSFWFPRRTPTEVFVRFGKWSRNWRSRNFITGEKEKGLSVYNAILKDGIVYLIGDDWSMNPALTAKACAHLLSGRLAFVVTGKVVGQGSDGEPLLVGVRLLPYSLDVQSIPAAIRKE